LRQTFFKKCEMNRLKLILKANRGRHKGQALKHQEHDKGINLLRRYYVTV